MQSYITQEHVESVIRTKFPLAEWSVLNYTLEGIGDENRNGFLGDHAILRVMLQSNPDPIKTQPITFFVKMFPHIPSVAKFATEIGAFDKEFLVYDIFEKFKAENINLVDMFIPRCYYKHPTQYFIMDNLIAEGYKSVDKLNILNYDEVVVVLSSLAKLHASSLIYEERLSAKLGKPVRLNEEFVIPESYFSDDEDFVNKHEMDASIVGILNSVDIFGIPQTLLSGKEIKPVMHKVCNSIYQLVKPSKKYRNVLCHGDIWATNFLIKYEDSRPINCKLIDFQCGRYVPPTHDVLAFIYLTTSREFRQKHMYHLIGLYYSFLEKHLAGAGLNPSQVLSFDEFLESSADAKPFALVQTASYFPLILLSSKDVMSYFTDEEIYKKAFLEDRSYLIKKHQHSDEIYIKRIHESILDLKDYCDYL